MEYLRETGKEAPKTWEEMEVLFGVAMDEKFPHVIPTRRYAFVTNNVRLLDGRILLVMRSPFRDVRLYTAWHGGVVHGLRERGRWVILQDAESVVRACYVQENAVVSAFAEAGIPLPTPDGLGEWPHEEAHRHGRNTEVILGCLGIGLVLAVLLARGVRRSNRTFQPSVASSSASFADGKPGADPTQTPSAGGCG